jgi:hypothetical protein
MFLHRHVGGLNVQCQQQHIRSILWDIMLDLFAEALAMHFCGGVLAGVSVRLGPIASTSKASETALNHTDTLLVAQALFLHR